MLPLRGQPSGADGLAVRLRLRLFPGRRRRERASGSPATRASSATCEARWEATGLPSREIDHLDERVTGYRTQRLPIDRAGESQTMNTQVACKKLLGDSTTATLGGLSFWTQPNSWHHFMSDHIVTFAVLPIAPTARCCAPRGWCTRMRSKGVDYDLKNLTSVWNATNDQDGELVGIRPDRRRSAAYEPGPYSPYTEELVEKFCNWYVGRMAAHCRAT